MINPTLQDERHLLNWCKRIIAELPGFADELYDAEGQYKDSKSLINFFWSITDYLSENKDDQATKAAVVKIINNRLAAIQKQDKLYDDIFNTFVSAADSRLVKVISEMDWEVIGEASNFALVSHPSKDVVLDIQLSDDGYNINQIKYKDTLISGLGQSDYLTELRQIFRSL